MKYTLALAALATCASALNHFPYDDARGTLIIAGEDGQVGAPKSAFRPRGVKPDPAISTKENSAVQQQAEFAVAEAFQLDEREAKKGKPLKPELVCERIKTIASKVDDLHEVVKGTECKTEEDPLCWVPVRDALYEIEAAELEFHEKLYQSSSEESWTCKQESRIKLCYKTVSTRIMYRLGRS